MKIRITREDTGNFGLRQRCGSYSTARLSNKTGNVPSATKSSRTMATSSRIIGIPREWEEPGEMIIRTTSKQHTGGATEKKDQQEWNDLRPISQLPSNQLMNSGFTMN